MLEWVMEDTTPATSFINKLNRRGERWSPRGTPEVTFIDIDIKFLYLANWIL